MYEQHGGNKNEIKRLQDFIQDYEERIPDLMVRFKENRISGTSIDDLQKLEAVIIEATKTLKEWAADKSFFRVFNSVERMRELERLQTMVMNSVRKALEFVNMAMLLHLVERQNRILEALEEPRPHPVQPSQLIADQASSTMNRRSERFICQEPSAISNILKPIKHNVVNEDHQLVAAEHGVVYIIWKDPSTEHTKVWMLKGHNDFVSSSNSQPFRSTSPPFSSSTSKLYLGVKMLPGGRPAVLVWRAEHLFYSLQSPRADFNTEWEYTFLIQSSTGCVLYCGCSDGTIEVWNHIDPNQPRVYSCQLTAHVGGISGLAVGKKGTLLSVDMKHSNIVRVWRNLQQVATLDLMHEKVHRMVCTVERNMYIATKGGSKLWCDLKNIVEHDATLGGHSPVFGLEIFSALQHPNSDPMSGARSCLIVDGASETVCFLRRPSRNEDTFCIEEWRGNEFVLRVDTGLKAIQAWTISRDGTVYCSSRSTCEICRWKLSKPNTGKQVVMG